MHGYSVVRRIHEKTADVLRIEEDSLYPVLHRLEEHGWVEVSFVRIRMLAGIKERRRVHAWDKRFSRRRDDADSVCV